MKVALWSTRFFKFIYFMRHSHVTGPESQSNCIIWGICGPPSFHFLFIFPQMGPKSVVCPVLMSHKQTWIIDLGISTLIWRFPIHFTHWLSWCLSIPRYFHITQIQYNIFPSSNSGDINPNRSYIEVKILSTFLLVKR